jgi:hypothetical protein
MVQFLFSKCYLVLNLEGAPRQQDNFLALSKA